MTVDWHLFDNFVKWVLIPLVGWVWLLWRSNAEHKTEIAVLKTQLVAIDTKVTANADSSNRQFDRIMEKLDDIEKALRK